MPVEIDSGTKDWFTKKFGALDDKLLSEFLSIKSLFNLSNDDVYIQWESFVVTQENGDLDLSAPNVEKFHVYLQDSLTASHQKKTPALKKVRDLSAKRKPPMDFSSSPGVVFPSTPQLKKTKMVPTSEPDSSPTKRELLSSPQKANSTESNTILESLNPQLSFNSFNSTVQLSANFDPEKFKFRTMAMKLLESADVLDEQIDSFSSMLSEHYKSSESQLSNPCMSSQFDILCCGRIVPDSPSYDVTTASSLNDKSLYLETSRLGGIGQRIPLDLSGLQEYSFFPGQIVGLKGRNPTGRTFIVREVLDLPQLGAPASTSQEIQEYSSDNNDAQKVFVASGPYSNEHTLNFDKLARLVELLNTQIKPQVAIFFGPFLDLSNKLVESGEFDFSGLPTNQQPKNLDEVFKLKLAPIFRGIDLSIQVILLPSLRDAISKHSSYPQTFFDRKKLGLPKNFKCFPNPCGFSLNEVMVGTSNLDIFKDLKDVYKSAVSADKSKISSNRFDRIANHIFQQRRYYPVFPGAVKYTSVPKTDAEKVVSLKDGIMAEDLSDIAIGGSCLEVPFLGLSELGDCLPDIMIIPSEMKFFAKIINGVVVVNPGSFIRPSRDASKEEGSYTVLSIKGANTEDDDNVEKVQGDLYLHNVYKRCKVDIFKS